VEQNDQLVLTLHATPHDIAAALVALDGRRMTVLSDWTTSRPASEAVKDIRALLRAMYPARRVIWWVAADLFDQGGRVALVDTLRDVGVELYPGGYIAPSKGSLTDLMRAQIEGRRLLQVAGSCRHTLNALSGGYRMAVGSDGRPKGEPERNASATLAIALEILTSEVEKGHTDRALPEGFGSSLNPQGVPYFSALRR
jgi:hypothetical protein